MTFYLQDGVPETAEGYRESRIFLDEYKHIGCAVLLPINAATWIDARLLVPEL